MKFLKNTKYDLFLNLEEAVFGGERDIEISFWEVCDCGGSGARSSSCIKLCKDCGGRGAVRQSQRTQFSVMSQIRQPLGYLNSRCPDWFLFSLVFGVGGKWALFSHGVS